MTCDPTPFSTVFQSYQDDGRMIMKCVQLPRLQHRTGSLIWRVKLGTKTGVQHVRHLRPCNPPPPTHTQFNGYVELAHFSKDIIEMCKLLTYAKIFFGRISGLPFPHLMQTQPALAHLLSNPVASPDNENQVASPDNASYPELSPDPTTTVPYRKKITFCTGTS